MSNDVWVVAWSPPAIAAGKQLAIAATNAGIGERFRQTLLMLNERLGSDPVGFGEVYWSKGGVVRHLGIQDLLTTNFSIDLKRKLVLVRDCNVLSGHGI